MHTNKKRKQKLDESKIVQAASDKVWKTSSSLIHSVEKVEKAIVHAAVDAVRDEVDVLFHDHDHDHIHHILPVSSKVTRKIPNRRTLSNELNTITKYPYGWGLD